MKQKCSIHCNAPIVIIAFDVEWSADPMSSTECRLKVIGIRIEFKTQKEKIVKRKALKKLCLCIISYTSTEIFFCQKTVEILSKAKSCTL